jgi:hypothetical protein
MLFAVSYTHRAGTSEERDRRTTKLFQNWQPPAGVEFKGFYDYCDGTGGISLVEAGSAELLLETTAPWSTFLEFSIKPIVPVETAQQIYEKATAWRDSIK